MRLTRWFDDLTRNDAFDSRKLINSPDVIKAARDASPIKYEKIGELCGVSKTTVSHWGNEKRTERPTRKQIAPLLKRYPLGLFNLELEPLNPAARSYRKGLAELIAALLLLSLLVLIWFLTIKPCQDEWKQCKQLPWYQMGAYEQLKIKSEIEGFREYKAQKAKGSSISAPR